ncbi:hypothetical protein SAMN05421820_109308 [Pedobacter steynii]|uniref:Uncharacterized protein n=1 Tax=Pedobacter steynii TaxID=430522 RepID=A0A1H0EJZ4_9SPHI|nr:hypothetical protein [Pedobacter steynii]NQX42036.1 hypothetical protein [Pedobacter steynii]SDN82660.1 hypothetical protein SAMN05421820_109308 [Pedobacter steynii]
MFRILSYANILFAIAYLLMFLLNGSNVVIFGILVVVVFNVIVVKNIQEGWGKPGLIYYVLGLGCLGFAAFLSVGLIHIVRSSIAYHYFSNTLNYMVLTTLFVLCIVIHFVFLCLYRKKE